MVASRYRLRERKREQVRLPGSRGSSCSSSSGFSTAFFTGAGQTEYEDNVNAKLLGTSTGHVQTERKTRSYQQNRLRKKASEARASEACREEIC